MINSFFSTLPCIISLCWLVIFVIRYRNSSHSQKLATFFAFNCVILYFCHACFFNHADNKITESVWTLCSLASYPLYLIYILSITEERVSSWTRWLMLLPALAIALMRAIVDDIWVDSLRQFFFIITVLVVCIIGMLKLIRFERKINDHYSDPANRSSRPIQWLLICFVLTSICSAFFNIIGKGVFSDSLLLVVPSTFFSLMLFTLFWIAQSYTFSMANLNDEILAEESMVSETTSTNDSQHNLGKTLRILMEEKKIFLQQDLKLTDLAREAGTCRTYLSTYLNNEICLSFSDYINSQRIRYAQNLSRMHPEMSAQEIAEHSGFTNLTTYKRNYVKFANR